MNERSQSETLHEVAVAVIVDGDEVLVTRRAPEGRFGGYDEFPGGHREPGESLEDCLRREVMEETGLAIEPERILASRRLAVRDGSLWLWFTRCRLKDARPSSLPRALEPRWMRIDQLHDARFPPPNARVVALLQREVAGLHLTQR